MKPEPSLQDPMSIGGETLAFTMQAEVEPATLDQAASGLLDMPDEPGMVRIPVTINVLIPDHLLHPPQPPPGEPGASGTPSVPVSLPRVRFGSYPRTVAARNLARTFKDARAIPREG